jgi:hypothetical protein
MLNSSKCELEKTKVKFLGHIDSQGIRADPDKTEAIRMDTPTSVTDLRRF